MSDSFSGKMDRLSIARLARSRGLPTELAEEVARVVVGSELPADRRSEVFEEMLDHFENGLAAGRSPGELLAAFGDAGRAARLIHDAKRSVTPPELGGGTPDPWPVQVARDLRYASRRLMARPVFTAIAVLSLALGIGANAAMFTLVNDVILRKPPVVEPERLLEVYFGPTFLPLSYPEMVDLGRDAGDVFEAVGGTKLTFAPRVDGDVPEQVVLEMVSPNFFELLRLRPAIGRLIESPDAPKEGTGAVAVLSYPYWQRAFGADPGVIGRRIKVGATQLQVIGVAPAGYPSSLRGLAVDVFVPITMIGQLDRLTVNHFTDRTNRGTFVKARLRPGITMARVQVTLARIAEDFKTRRLGRWEADDAFNVVPASEVIVYPPLDKILVPVAAMLMVVVGMVLIIACANLAAFLLARAIDRRKEVAVRLALGATRGQLISQLLVESLLLSAAGGAIGVILGRSVLRLVMAADLPIPLPLEFGLALDWRVLGFAALVSILSAVMFGLAPALQATRLELASVIRDESTGGGRSKGWLRNVLVAGQVAVSVVLLVAAGLFVRSLGVLKGVDPGFGREPAALVWLGLPTAPDPNAQLQTLDRLGRRLIELPEVRSVGATDNLLLSSLGFSVLSVQVDGVDPPQGRRAWEILRASVDTGYLAASGQTLIEGRNFSAPDIGRGRVALVNTAFVDQFWPGKSGVGRRFRDGDGQEIEIVGVVNTAKGRSLAESPQPYVYQAIGPGSWPVFWLLVRTNGDPDAATPAILRAIREVEPDVMVIQTRSMARHLETMSLPVKLGATVLAGFAGLALLMACIGLYGTVSYAVAQRSREVGIRLSLGADQGSVVRMLLWGGLRLVAAGVGVGIVLAVLAAGALRGLLVGVHALDPVTFLVVPTLLLVVALVAAYLPARVAGRVDPTSALRGSD